MNKYRGGRSASQLKPEILAWMEKINPKTIVDLGPGQGSYIKLAKKPGQHWTGIEIFAPYVKANKLDELYDKIIISDALYIGLGHLSADLIIAGDILEHMEKADALKMIERATGMADHLIISIPIIPWPQHEIDGNKYEAHLHHWTFEEMEEELGNRVIDSARCKILGAFLVRGV